MKFLRDILIPQDIWDAVIGILGEEKGRRWFFTPNPLLGDVKPTTMIASGRTKQLRKAVESLLRSD